MSSLTAKELYDYLLELSDFLEASGQHELAKNLYIASRFSVSSASELFGEARIALRQVLDYPNLPDDARIRLIYFLSGIDFEFNKLGN